MLMHGGNVVRSYHVAARARIPSGQKERSGDFRTPEGSYRLERRNPRSDFFLSIKVSYPNPEDLRRAHAHHWDTGGSIMIHGLPNSAAGTSRTTTRRTTGPTAASPSPTPTWSRSGCWCRTTCRSTSCRSSLRGQRVFRVRRRARRSARQSREPFPGRDRQAARHRARAGLYPLFRRCALAVLNSGAPTDNAKEIFDRYRDFEIRIVRHPWGVKLEMQNAPAAAFVDGQMIRGIKEHLFAVLRDVVFISNEIIESGRFDLTDSASITNAVFHVLRNAHLLDYKARPNLVVCWGGHSIDAARVPVHQERGLRARPARPRRVHRLRPGRHEGADEGRHHRPRQAAHRARPLHRHHRAGHHRRRAAQPDRDPAGDHAGHREAPRGLRAPGARHRGVSRGRRHRRGDPLPHRHPARPGQPRAALPDRAHRPEGERGLLRAHRALPRRDPRRARRCGASR